MDILYEWLGYLARWGHVLAGITWVGTSFYFNWLDLSDRKPKKATLNPNVRGSLNEMHGGSFYYHERYWPTDLPKRMLAHSGPAQLTFLTGVLLIVHIYWLDVDAYLSPPSGDPPSLIDSISLSATILFVPYLFYDAICRCTDNERVVTVLMAILVLAVSWVATSHFSARAAFVHVGAMLGTIMALNVHFQIIPNHIKMRNQVANGQEVDLTFHKRAKRHSQHNNYFTLPVVFSMLSVHFPLALGNDYAWLVLFFVMGSGFWIRHYRNVLLVTDRKERGWGWLSAGFLAAGIALTFIPATSAVQDRDAFADAQEAEVFDIVQVRCTVCHSANPTMEGWTAAPAGVLLETIDHMVAQKDKIHAQTIAEDIMPPGNLTKMTNQERAKLSDWLTRRGVAGTTAGG